MTYPLDLDAIERAIDKGLYGYPVPELCAELRQTRKERDAARDELSNKAADYVMLDLQYEKDKAQRERDEALATLERLKVACADITECLRNERKIYMRLIESSQSDHKCANKAADAKRDAW